MTKSVTENMRADVLGQDHLDAIIAEAEEVLIIALILLFSSNSIDFQADYVTDLKMSIKYCLPVPRLLLYTVSQKKLSRFVFVRTSSNFHEFR